MKTGIKTDLTLPSSVETAITIILKKFLKVQGRTLKVSVKEKETVFFHYFLKIFFFYKGVEENTEEPENILRLLSLLWLQMQTEITSKEPTFS